MSVSTVAPRWWRSTRDRSLANTSRSVQGRSLWVSISGTFSRRARARASAASSAIRGETAIETARTMPTDMKRRFMKGPLNA